MFTSFVYFWDVSLHISITTTAQIEREKLDEGEADLGHFREWTAGNKLSVPSIFPSFFVLSQET